MDHSHVDMSPPIKICRISDTLLLVRSYMNYVKANLECRALVVQDTMELLLTL